MSARVVLFWLLAVLITAGVVAALVWPLVRRQKARTLVKREVNVQVLRDQLVELESDLKAGTLSQSQYDEAKLDISRRLLEDLTSDPLTAVPAPDPATLAKNRRLAVGLGVLIPVLGVAAYLHWGTPVALDESATAAMQTAAQGEGGQGEGGQGNGGPASKHEITPQKIQAMIDQLRKKLDAQPNSPQDAAMLARALNFIGKYPEAVEAYKKALPLNPGDAELMADYADALAMSQNRTLGPEVMKLIQQSLKTDPQNMKALALAATEAFQRKDYKTAIDFWKRAIPSAEQREPEMANQFRVNIVEANQLGGGKLIKESEIPGGNPLAAGQQARAEAPAAAAPASDGGTAAPGQASVAR